MIKIKICRHLTLPQNKTCPCGNISKGFYTSWINKSNIPLTESDTCGKVCRLKQDVKALRCIFEKDVSSPCIFCGKICVVAKLVDPKDPNLLKESGFVCKVCLENYSGKLSPRRIECITIVNS